MKARIIKRSPSQQAAYLRTLATLESQSFEPQDNGGGDLEPGAIYLSNASRFSETFFSQGLTTYSAGWRDTNDLDATRQFFAPEVEVPDFFEYWEAINAEEFLVEDDDGRAIGGDFKIIEPYKMIKRLDKLENRGLSMVVDLDTVRGQPDTVWQQKKVAKLLRRIKRNRLRRSLNLLSAAAVNTAKTWDTSAGKDPDMDIHNEQLLSTTASGVGFNRVGYGHTAWVKRKLAHRAQNSAGGFASAGLSIADLAGELAVDRVLVSKERYQSSASAKAEMVGNLVLAFWAQDDADVEDATNIKCFVGRPQGEGVIGFYRVYIQQISAKKVMITIEYYEKQKITSTLGIRKLTIT